MAVDRALINHDDGLLGNQELSIRTTATHPHAQTRALRRPVPEIGERLSLGRRYDSPAIGRFPRVQDGVADGRRVKCPTESAGKRSGTSGTKRGHADLKWAGSEAAGLCRRHHPAGPQDRTTLAHKPGKGNA